MGTERFHEGGGEPSQKADASPPKDTGSPQDAGRSGDTPSPKMSPAPKNQLWKARLVSPRKG